MAALMVKDESAVGDDENVKADTLANQAIEAARSSLEVMKSVRANIILSYAN